MYIVILAGGGGTRLRPLSRPDRPKPFLPLLGDETLFQRTVRRVQPLVGPDDVYVVADRRYGALVQEQAPDVRLLVEPTGRNTAAAIALATAAIERPDDDVMVVLPADHWIRDEDGFRDTLRAAHDELALGAFGVDQPLVTLGVQVDRPATEYGYLLPDLDRRQTRALRAYVLRAFEEKPSGLRAGQLLNEPGVAWNAGMFLWQRSAIRVALEKYTPLPMLIGQAYRSELALAAAYDRIQPISIDVAVMEGAARDRIVLMGAMDVGWSDLGSWTALLAVLGQDGRGVSGRVIQTGDTFDAGPEDLVVRARDGELVVEEAREGTIVADGVWAHLAGARRLGSEVRALLERVKGQESRA
ncbi:MAG TPA: sugar phosphate nucleotidyltransferase [Vitreimonas sp.]|nr:sugar phosphate nucleotidyltransferase [Vitreimonas sp.]